MADVSPGLYDSSGNSPHHPHQLLATETTDHNNGTAVGNITRSTDPLSSFSSHFGVRTPMELVSPAFITNVTPTLDYPSIKYGLSNELTVAFMVLELLFAAFIIIGNGVVLFYICRRADLRKPAYMYIGSIAFSHLLVGVIVIPLYICSHFPENFMNDLVCKTGKFMASLASTASPYSAVILAVHHVRERHKLGQMQIKNVHVAIDLSVVWVLSLCYGGKDIYLYEMVLERYSHGETIELVYMCEVPHERQTMSDIFVLADFVLLYCIPAGMLCALYLRLVQQVIAAHKRLVRQTQEAVANGNVPNGRPANDTGPGPFQDPQTKNMICTLTILVSAFCLCFLGVHIWEIYVYWGPGHFKDSLVILNILELASFSQGWMNVVLIFIFNDAFRRAVRRRRDTSWDIWTPPSLQSSANIIASLTLPADQLNQLASARVGNGVSGIRTTRV